RFVDGGGLWLELTTESAPMTVDDVRWSVAAPRPQRPTSVAICTYNRVDDCLNTLAAMADDPDAGEVVESVVVVDQGSDPLESRPRFAAVGELLGPEILVRLTAFATCTTHPTIVGGQMLNLLHPAHLHISAEYAEPETLRVGRAVPGALKE